MYNRFYGLTLDGGVGALKSGVSGRIGIEIYFSKSGVARAYYKGMKTSYFAGGTGYDKVGYILTNIFGLDKDAGREYAVHKLKEMGIYTDYYATKDGYFYLFERV